MLNKLLDSLAVFRWTVWRFLLDNLAVFRWTVWRKKVADFGENRVFCFQYVKYRSHIVFKYL